MSRKTIIICGIFFIVMLLIVAMFHKSENPEDIEKQLANDVVMTIKEGTLTNTGATVIITETGDKKYIHGSCFYLQQFQNNEWKYLNQLNEMTCTAMAYYTNENNTLEMNQNWEYAYGVLSEGKYRIGKSCFLDMDRAVTKNDYLHYYAEFEIK